ncbi:hypothetical protein M409DRAFT_24832 [Zasmidium cellare ATCC 36951]|uniref:Uncharacterized protein n=1 Tax=Zasmidium cellare ATCC 36951 TaxID=1080233 RepID=A0A6A6CFA1_ZASCE|nr:uncharacterized protein M409DRAFT_24832 [Zasmidium cellare ATCC 36951]KAF2164930.1 hypothetical protein M409DRAFT_24832 [Zasmidium cellare ATCC 36951]
MSLTGKVALITGGVKNLGAQIARELAPLGASLALHYNSASSKPHADSLIQELTSAHPTLTIKIYTGDLTTEFAINALFTSVKADFPKIDIIINTVGKVLKKPVLEISEAEYDSMFAINSKSAFFILKAGAQHVEDGGKLITIVTSLLAAYTGGYTSYAGSKAPVEHFTRGLSKELMGRGVSVNAIAPGPMDTPFFYPQEGDDAVAFHKSQAIGNHLTKIEDIAPIVKFLVTEGWWFNGQTLFANGGYTTR